MTDRDAAVDAVMAAVHDEIGNCYGGALSLAWVHGWKYTGETTDDNWPVRLDAAVRAAVEQAIADARIDGDWSGMESWAKAVMQSWEHSSEMHDREWYRHAATKLAEKILPIAERQRGAR